MIIECCKLTMGPSLFAGPGLCCNNGIGKECIRFQGRLAEVIADK